MNEVEVFCVPDDPTHCMREGCDEELNGLYLHLINKGKGFNFELWLCENCKNVFKEVREKEHLRRLMLIDRSCGKGMTIDLEETDKLVCYLDGDALCIVRKDFEDLQASPSVFLDLTKEQLKDILDLIDSKEEKE